MHVAVFSSGQDAKHLQQDTFNTSSVFVYIPGGDYSLMNQLR